MPNWCSNTVEITAKTEQDADFLISAFKFKDQDFSFNSFIPIPKELNVVCGTVTSMAKDYIKELALATTKEALKKLEEKWRKEAKDVDCNAFRSNDENSVSFGRGYEAFIKYADAISKNIANFGYPTWLEWSYANWGTKWDVTDPTIIKKGNQIEIEFDTAWSPPIPIFEYISEHFANHIECMVVKCVERGCRINFSQKYI